MDRQLVTRQERKSTLKTFKRLGLPALLVALALALAACGGGGAAGSGGGMDHEAMGHEGSGEQGSQAARGATQETTGGAATATDNSGMDHSEMDHGSMGGEGMARQMLEDENGNYSDERFIDMMVPHHEGAVEMAEVALENSDREEILELSRNIVRAQEAEIEDLKAIKQEEFGTSEIPTDMTDEEMQAMGMGMDADELAGQEPFDRAFIDHMIPHHQSAIDMANVALRESDNERIRRLAGDIVEAQEREIAQMEGWRRQWYPEG